jgi:DNA-binding LacI/PurR family transcriptional regulator
MDSEAPKIRTMEDFASASGISRPTVSKYFHDPNSVKKVTRERIEAALEQYNFRPNLFAMNQNRRLTKNIGIVVPYLADPFFAEIARNIERRCLDAGYFPMLFSSHGETSLENDIFNTLLSLRPAGVLLAPLGRNSDRRAVEDFCQEVPTVLFDSDLEGIGEAFVGSNNFQSIALIVEYLCRTGEPPSFFEMPPVNPNANKRRDAYIAAMEALGLVPEVIHVDGEGWGFEEVGYREGMRVISERKLPTNTILCSNDRLAIGLLAAAYEKGLRVGRGSGFALRVAGHDDHPFARFTSPSLTTVAQDYAAIAETSVDTLFRLLESGGKWDTRESRLFEGTLVMRHSA